MESKDPDLVKNAILMLFPNENWPAVMSILNLYGVEPHEREQQRVHLAIIRLSNGDEARLKELVSIAKRDYRDVLMWAEYPPTDPVEAAKALDAIAGMLERSGDIVSATEVNSLANKIRDRSQDGA